MTRLLQSAWHRALSLWYEAYLGIDTRGAVDSLTAEGVHYTPLPYAMIFRLIDFLSLTPTDVFVDVGCGKGRVTACVCRLPVERVVALELNRALLDKAVVNATRVRGRTAPIEAVHGPAGSYDYHDATVVYLYNPFNERLTSELINRLFASYSERPRPIRVVYANPVHELALVRHGWLQKFAEWPATDFPSFGYPVSFWSSSSIRPTTHDGDERRAGGA